MTKFVSGALRCDPPPVYFCEEVHGINTGTTHLNFGACEVS